MNVMDIILIVVLIVAPIAVAINYYIYTQKDFCMYYKEPSYTKSRDFDYFSINLRNGVLNYVSEDDYVQNYEYNEFTQAAYNKWKRNQFYK